MEERQRHTTTRDLTRTTNAIPDDCPFCPGNEKQTPPEITKTSDGDPLDVIPDIIPAPVLTPMEDSGCFRV